MAKRGAKAGQSHQDPPDEWRCQRIVALMTSGKIDLWRCGKRVRQQGGNCAPHHYVADAALAE